jgi:hypothetical protein
MTQDEIIEMAEQVEGDAIMIEVLKQAYQLLLTEPHAPTVCDQLEVIFRQAIAELESQEQNFCPRCGKRTNDIHTCTPPQRSESSGKPSAWVGLTNEELTDLFYNANLGQQSAVSQAVALLKERNS